MFFKAGGDLLEGPGVYIYIYTRDFLLHADEHGNAEVMNDPRIAQCRAALLPPNVSLKVFRIKWANAGMGCVRPGFVHRVMLMYFPGGC